MIYQLFAGNIADSGRISLPASKSLSNRALILKALCDGQCQLHNVSDCDDTRVMLQAFEQPISSADGPVTIDIGAAGTSMRFLTAYYATRPGSDILLTGSQRMKQRPISILVDALRGLGADIEYAEADGFPPLHIRGKQLDGGEMSIDGSTSSQYISALLMVAPTLKNGLRLTLTGAVTSRPYIEMTLAMMRQFGVESSFTANVIDVRPQSYTAHEYAVESDWSAASYWYEILALGRQTSATTQPLREFLLLGLHSDSLQGDCAIARYFDELGIQTEFTADGARLSANGKPLPQSVKWNLANQPDLAQTLVVTCCGLGVAFTIDGLHTLRIKETDRLAALQNELHKCGYVVEVKGDDTMTWNGQTCPLNEPVMIRTYKDHRMAMSFAPLAITMFNRFGHDMEAAADQDALYIHHPEVVSKSYPTFWNDLRSVGIDIGEIDKGGEAFMADRKRTMQHAANVHRRAKFIVNSLIFVALATIIMIVISCLI